MLRARYRCSYICAEHGLLTTTRLTLHYNNSTFYHLFSPRFELIIERGQYDVVEFPQIVLRGDRR
jgi:hypothetical protein